MMDATWFDYETAPDCYSKLKAANEENKILRLILARLCNLEDAEVDAWISFVKEFGVKS